MLSLRWRLEWRSRLGVATKALFPDSAQDDLVVWDFEDVLMVAPNPIYIFERIAIRARKWT